MNSQLIQIIVAPLVEWLCSQNFPMPQPPIRFYPDGSLWTNDEAALTWTLETRVGGCLIREVLWVSSLFLHKLPGAYSSCSFRPLAPFKTDGHVTFQYSLLYPGSCDWIGDTEQTVLLYPGIAKGISSDEHDLSRVQVLVRLRRKFTGTVATALAGVVKRWFEEIGSKGVFGDAGVKSISAALCYSNRDAGFKLDARGSGQETLNTLYLAILNWAMANRKPLCMIDLAPDRNELVFASEVWVPLL
jgi:hypothetical protein